MPPEAFRGVALPLDSADLSGEGARFCFFAAKEAAAGVNDGAISS
jgi:hypothetical protein